MALEKVICAFVLQGVVIGEGARVIDHDGQGSKLGMGQLHGRLNLILLSDITALIAQVGVFVQDTFRSEIGHNNPGAGL